MIFIPSWCSNILLLVTVYLSGFQHVQLKRPNPVTNIQFFMMIFCMFMIVVITLSNKRNPWVSLVFFLIAVASFVTMIRQHRMLPPMKPIE